MAGRWAFFQLCWVGEPCGGVLLQRSGLVPAQGSGVGPQAAGQWQWQQAVEKSCSNNRLGAQAQCWVHHAAVLPLLAPCLDAQHAHRSALPTPPPLRSCPAWPRATSEVPSATAQQHSSGTRLPPPWRQGRRLPGQPTQPAAPPCAASAARWTACYDGPTRPQRPINVCSHCNAWNTIKCLVPSSLFLTPLRPIDSLEGRLCFVSSSHLVSRSLALATNQQQTNQPTTPACSHTTPSKTTNQAARHTARLPPNERPLFFCRSNLLATAQTHCRRKGGPRCCTEVSHQSRPASPTAPFDAPPASPASCHVPCPTGEAAGRPPRLHSVFGRLTPSPTGASTPEDYVHPLVFYCLVRCALLNSAPRRALPLTQRRTAGRMDPPPPPCLAFLPCVSPAFQLACPSVPVLPIRSCACQNGAAR